MMNFQQDGTVVINIPGGTKEDVGDAEDVHQMLWDEDSGQKKEKKGGLVAEGKGMDCYDDDESGDLYTEIEETEILRVPPPPPPPPLPPRQVTLRRCFLHFISFQLCHRHRNQFAVLDFFLN